MKALEAARKRSAKGAKDSARVSTKGLKTINVEVL